MRPSWLPQIIFAVFLTDFVDLFLKSSYLFQHRNFDCRRFIFNLHDVSRNFLNFTNRMSSLGTCISKTDHRVQNAPALDLNVGHSTRWTLTNQWDCCIWINRPMTGQENNSGDVTNGWYLVLLKLTRKAHKAVTLRIIFKR